MIDADLLKRIRKCLALGESPNEHEAAAALQMARRLMDAHGITDDDLAMVDICDAAARGSRAERPALWESILSATICRALSVSVLLDADRDRRFIGRGPAPEIAAYAFITLYRSLKRARAAYIQTHLRRCRPGRKRARADAYCEGWAGAVFSKVAALYPRGEDSQDINRYIATHFGALVATRVRSASQNRTDSDHWRGWDQGADVNLHNGVGRQAIAAERLTHG